MFVQCSFEISLFDAELIKLFFVKFFLYLNLCLNFLTIFSNNIIRKSVVVFFSKQNLFLENWVNNALNLLIFRAFVRYCPNHWRVWWTFLPLKQSHLWFFQITVKKFKQEIVCIQKKLFFLLKFLFFQNWAEKIT